MTNVFIREVQKGRSSEDASETERIEQQTKDYLKTPEYEKKMKQQLLLQKLEKSWMSVP